MLTSVLLFISILCFASFCGLGLLQLFGLHGFQQRLLLAPSMALAASAIVLALIVILGIPVGVATPFFWLFWIVFAVYGAIHFRSAWVDQDNKYILWTSVLVTLLVTSGFFWYGLSDYLGSPALDGWSYVSFGEYIRQYPKGTEGGLAPVYQYAMHLSGTRFVASAMLAALIPPWTSGVDTQMTVGPLIILSIFSFATSMAYAAQMVNQRGLATPICLGVFFGVVGGWIPLALNSNNYDNLLALPFAPALFALASDRNLNKIGQLLLPAIFIAASIYIYPELSPLIIAAYGVVAVGDLFLTQAEYKNKPDRGRQLFKYGAVAVIALVIVSPYLQDAVRFFSQQLSGTTQMTGRPGEGIMPSLLNYDYILGAIWSFGPNALGIIVGILLGQIVLFGAITAIEKKCFSIILYLVFISVLFVIMVTLKHYDYGAYKILLLGWWAMAIVLAAGAKRIWDVVSSPNRLAYNYLKIPLVAVVLTATSLWLAPQYNWIHGYKYKTATQSREARDAVLKNQSAVQVTIADPILNAWMVFQLRNSKALFSEFHGYMDQSHLHRLMARSRVPSEDEIQYVLSEVDSVTIGDLVWKNDLFKLVKGTPNQQPPQVTINAPNGREVLDGMPFFWLGREPASIVLTTSKQKIIRIDFEAWTGPSVGASIKDYPKIFIENTGKQLLAFDTQSTKNHTVLIALSPGSNTLVFRNEYAGSVVPNSNPDPRILLVGIKLVKVVVNDQ